MNSPLISLPLNIIKHDIYSVLNLVFSANAFLQNNMFKVYSFTQKKNNLMLRQNLTREGTDLYYKARAQPLLHHESVLSWVNMCVPLMRTVPIKANCSCLINNKDAWPIEIILLRIINYVVTVILNRVETQQMARSSEG